MLAKTTVRFGMVLMLLSLMARMATGSTSMTLWIPAFFGIGLAISGAFAQKESRRKLWMHIAATVGLLGTLGGLGMGLPKLPQLLADEAERPMAIILQLSMGVVCLVFVVLCVRSFIQARRSGAN